MPERNLKKLIVELLSEHHLLSAHQILEQLLAQKRHFNKTSVYRALDQLVETDQVCPQHFLEAETVYELRAHHHTHLVCERCGSVAAADCKFTEPKNIDGFQVTHHHVTLMGLCQSCATLAEQKN
jgi:Fe2+ or Zn2+ uptake regulation protein